MACEGTDPRGQEWTLYECVSHGLIDAGAMAPDEYDGKPYCPVSQPPDSSCGLLLRGPVQVVYASRLREVEAERDELKRIVEFDRVVPIHEHRAVVERLEAALREAISVVSRGRQGQIGASRVHSAQVNVETVERWREALAPDQTPARVAGAVSGGLGEGRGR